MYSSDNDNIQARMLGLPARSPGGVPGGGGRERDRELRLREEASN